MINIALIDDNLSDLNTLKSFIDKYTESDELDSHIEVNITTYNDPTLFLNENNFKYDLIFLDIEMPKINGISLKSQICIKYSLIVTALQN